MICAVAMSWEETLYFLLIEPRGTYAAEGSLSFGYLCHTSSVFPTVGYASKSSISSSRCHKRNTDNETVSQHVMAQTKGSVSG